MSTPPVNLFDPPQTLFGNMPLSITSVQQVLPESLSSIQAAEAIEGQEIKNNSEVKTQDTLERIESRTLEIFSQPVNSDEDSDGELSGENSPNKPRQNQSKMQTEKKPGILKRLFFCCFK
jgi:hypothetical protein